MPSALIIHPHLPNHSANPALHMKTDPHKSTTVSNVNTHLIIQKLKAAALNIFILTMKRYH